MTRDVAHPIWRLNGQFPRWSAAMVLLLSASTGVNAQSDEPVRSAPRIVAPNTSERAFGRVAPAVVKLYGRGIGREHGYATGTLVSPDGKIVTALSLLTMRDGTRVVLADGRTFTAKVESRDEVRQLAMLKIEGDDFPFVEFVSSDFLSVGDAVFAMGNWFKVAEGKEPVSINRGIFSLRMDLDARRLTQDFTYDGPALVFDAITANPGAPGGPLVDIEGRCVGIVGRIVESSATNTRINYALPSEEITSFIGGQVTTAPSRDDDTPKAKPYVGISISKLGFRHVSPYVSRVRLGSPAQKAGVQTDDLVMMIDGQRLRSTDDYQSAIDRLSPGDDAQFVLKRGNRIVTVVIKVEVME